MKPLPGHSKSGGCLLRAEELGKDFYCYDWPRNGQSPVRSTGCRTGLCAR